ncbi:hypothetical protein SLEP1_g10404 [Rubroshorea leprosula]|uniref:Uncharacterized protein n=1 Tax=Rubroshorea leprosula TaxID=152421 RepID=A0AAV5IFX9_9ROSI|nr:hypothetical protein SLEP1_g10404 [Rubroshorea leprosula]
MDNDKARAGRLSSDALRSFSAIAGLSETNNGARGEEQRQRSNVFEPGPARPVEPVELDPGLKTGRLKASARLGGTNRTAEGFSVDLLFADRPSISLPPIHQPHSGRQSRGQCDLAASLVPDCKKLGKESSKARHAAVVATELEEDEDEDATKETDCGDVEKVLDVAIPGAVHFGVTVEGRGRRRRGSLVHWGGGFGD